MKFLVFLSLVSLSTGLLAANTTSTNSHEISKMYFYSEEESINPTFKGLVRVVLKGEIVWNNNGVCDTASVLVRNEDKHLISALLTAKATSSPINLYADDDLKNEIYCYLRAVGV